MMCLRCWSNSSRWCPGSRVGDHRNAELEASERRVTALGREWIAVSLPLRPGYSGGPLVDARGRLVGINTMVVGPQVGMAVPVHLVKQFLREELGSTTVRQ